MQVARHRAFHAALALAALAVGAPACTVPATQLLVSVDTDFYVPSELDTLRVRVLYATDRAGTDPPPVPLATPPPLDAPAGAELVIGGVVHELRRTVDFDLREARLPIELSLVPAEGDARRIARVEAYGLRDGVVRARASVRSRFARHRTSRLGLFVFVACVDIECPAGTTCGAGGACVPDEVPESCLTDPRLCADAGAPTVDAGPPPVDAGAVCGDGVWAPDTEACDGTPDCNGSCRLVASPTTGTFDAPIAIPATPGRHEYGFAGYEDQVISPVAASSSWATTRDVVFSIDLGPSPRDVLVRSDDATLDLTLTLEPPGFGPYPACIRGASSSGYPPVTPLVVGRGLTGTVYLVVSELNASATTYDRRFAFEIGTPDPLAAAGTCGDPWVIPRSGLLWIPSGSSVGNAVDLTGPCARTGEGEVIVAPIVDGRPITTVTVLASDRAATVALLHACGPGPQAAVCAGRAPQCATLPMIMLDRSAQPTASDRWIVDGIRPATAWVALSYR